jgi:hypothetical protein
MTQSPTLERKHDFTAKLRQRGFLPAVSRYVDWRRALKHAREHGLPEPDIPVDIVPGSINLDLTTACNYACDHCIDFEILNGKLKHQFEVLLESLGRMIERGLRSVILIGGGEPTLHPKFREVVSFLKKRGVQVALVSNGSRGKVVHESAELFTAGDWVRFSLDAGTEETFQRMHKPKKPITLGEICSWVPRIREANPALSAGFSFIITWEGAMRDSKVPLVANIDEIVRAAELARTSGFTYLSLKSILTRHPSGSEVMDPGVMQDFERTLDIIRASIAEAQMLETADFKVIVSTNLRMLLAGTWQEFTKQPKTCHMQAFRHVVSPLGIYNCPAYRGSPDARITGADAFTAQQARVTDHAVAGMLDTFDPSCRCREITCLYQPTNWWIENLINGASGATEMPGDDYFL